MRYRIRGRDKASQSPVELFFLDAADEEEARNKASELGAVVDRVEGAPQKDEAIQPRAERATPPQPAASMPVTDNRPLASTALPWTRRRWLLLCLVLFLASLAGGIWIGIACPRLLPLGLGTPTPSAGIRLEELQSAEPSAGIRLEELKSAEELFALAGQEAVVVRYSGGDVEFWVEIESQGKKEKIGPVRALHGLLGDQEKLPSPNQIVEGYLLWLRGDADETGREAWRLACRRDLVGTEPSGLQVSTPLAEASVSRSREDKQSSTMSSSGLVGVWGGKKPRGTGQATKSSFPSPLPPDREVCIKEINVTGSRRDEWAIVSASTIGLLDSPLGGGPFLAATALTPGRAGEPVEGHTIKVMCKAISAQGKGANGQPPAK